MARRCDTISAERMENDIVRVLRAIPNRSANTQEFVSNRNLGSSQVVEARLFEDRDASLANIAAGCLEQTRQIEPGTFTKTIRSEVRVELGSHGD